ncbi:MAG: nucleoside hydrolase [Bacteroides sp.]|nr:nucleoside hydrolase [Bacteroides sp.]
MSRINKIQSLALIAFLILTGCATTPPPIKIIFDTDFGGDADDLGALAMLNHFENKGEIDLMAVMCWNTEKYAVSAIDAVNTFYGNPDIAIGLRQGGTHEETWNYTGVLADNLPHNSSNENAANATELYRQVLSKSEDKSVVIVAVGPFLNLKELIDSKADQFSDLNGSQLISAKVKEFVFMGGQFPSGENEWNFNGDMPGVTKYVLENINIPITFLGFELGASLKTGEVFNELAKDSPLYLGFYHFSENAPWVKQRFEGRIVNNSTFDQTAVLYAVRGGIGSYWHRVENGFCVADDFGGNTWEERENSNHSYLVLDMPKEEMEEELEAFMLGEF